jgi:hypothetical protein
MMKAFLLAPLAIFLNVFSASAQEEQPVSWTVEVKKLDNDQFQINATAKMKEGFHIWALNAGGDGSLINTNIDVTTSGIKWSDNNWTANKRAKTERYDYIEGAVNYFERAVTFTRSFTVDGDVKNVEGQVTYQACNEMMCYPPQDVPFAIEIK